MKNDSPAMLAAVARARGLLRSSEPSLLCPAAPQALSLLEEAAELLVLDRDFAAAVDRCEKGCQSLLESEGDSDGSSSEDLKCSLCIVGIQALAEMDRWREVLPWVLQYYHKPEGWPPKILELCILLHSKVEEPHVMLDVGRDWLYCPSNPNLSSYGLLAQLYLFHVLLPLGHFLAAEELIQDCKALSQEQRENMHKTLQEKKHQWLQKEEASPIPEEQPEMSWKLQLGSVSQRMLTILGQLRRVLESLASHFSFIPFKKTLLVALLLCLIVLRLDPASPASLPFLYRLTQLFHQARLALFPPSRRPPVQD
ncbi:peroxisome assembly protein 26 [Pantherophis guttatus]|uniref:Peroxisome assembly protein 26 n=1 Tax=Pantherophis guttatus TaxID=94885 RepID=A0A6P9AJN0_PANGU|nr:peroxisome assembly protein 26 [Pantherophis guttatus]XP_034258748.1 peroxisome assembly protein 26 [Pantherophis guttatus]